MEAWFSILTRKSVRRGSFDSVTALVKHIEHYIARWNENPTPFVWTRADYVWQGGRVTTLGRGLPTASSRGGFLQSPR